MDSIYTITQMITQDCCMGSIDLSDAYFSVSIREADRKFLRFVWNGQLFEFCVLPQGLASAPRLFTKLLKPVFAHLRSQGFESCAYLDDSYFQSRSKEHCAANISATKSLLLHLGFTINEGKSVLQPTQRLGHLDFVLDSKSMTVSLTEARKKTIFDTAQFVMNNRDCLRIRQVAKLTGLIVASEPGVDKCFLHFRGLEMDQITALAQSKGNFDAFMQLSGLAIQDVQWWIGNVQSVFKPLCGGPINFAVFTDASLEGWGAVMPSAGTHAQGIWSPVDKQEHTNILELKAVLLGLKHLCHLLSDQHIQLHIDSMTAVNYIKNFGGTRSPACNAVTWEIWDWADNRNIWLSPTHIAGKDNVVADRLSRQPVRNDFNITEWSLDSGTLDQVWQVVDKPDIDLFASSLNTKCHRGPEQ